jgi:hypothetical protein
MTAIYVPEKTRHFQKNKAAIQDLLQKLTTECEGICNQDPEWMNWAQVEQMGWVVNQLRELLERN